MKEWGFVKGSHLEYLPESIPWQSQEVADLITQKFWQSKTDSQIWSELQKEGYGAVTYCPVEMLTLGNDRSALFVYGMGCRARQSWMQTVSWLFFIRSNGRRIVSLRYGNWSSIFARRDGFGLLGIYAMRH
jgi:hypothetical protein